MHTYMYTVYDVQQFLVTSLPLRVMSKRRVVAHHIEYDGREQRNIHHFPTIVEVSRSWKSPL